MVFISVLLIVRLRVGLLYSNDHCLKFGFIFLESKCFHGETDFIFLWTSNNEYCAEEERSIIPYFVLKVFEIRLFLFDQVRGVFYAFIKYLVGGTEFLNNLVTIRFVNKLRDAFDYSISALALI